jgi:phosphoribosylformylglycinamidine (FGAM) synthase-like enzyme
MGCRGIPGHRPDAVLFGECNSAVVVSFASDKEQPVKDLCARHGVPVIVLGKVAGGSLVIQDCSGGDILRAATAQMKDAWQNGIPNAAK